MKDYSNIDSVLQGAQMAMQAAGIKDKREQDTLMQKFREHQMSMDVQAGERAEMQAKINEMNAKTQREMFELNAEKFQMEQAQAQAEMAQKQIAEAQREMTAKNFSMPGTEYDYFDSLAQDLIRTGKSDNVVDLISKVKGMGETPREVKPYFNKEGKVEYLPNNVKPPVGWTPYSKPSTASTASDKNILIVAQEAGIPIDKVKTGSLNPQEAKILLDAYIKRFGSFNLLEAILGLSGQGGLVSENTTPTIEFDKDGNRIQK